MKRFLFGMPVVLALSAAAHAQALSGGCAAAQPCQNLASLSVSPSTTTRYVGPGGDFPNLTTALAEVNKQVLPFGTNWSLVLLDGQIAEPGAVLYSVEGGNNVTISGQHVYTFSLSSIQGSSGAQGSWSYVLNLDAVANIAVGDYLTIPAPSGGTSPSYIAGVWPVTAVDAVNNRVTVATTSRSPTAASGAVIGTVTDMKSTVKFTNSDGFDIWGGGVTANLSNFNVVGDGSANHNGISLQDDDRLYSSGALSVSGFGSINIFALYNSEMNSSGNIVTSSGGQGIYANDGAVVNARILVSSGNIAQGVFAANGGIVEAQTFIAAGNGSDGAKAVGVGFVTANVTGTYSGNGGNGAVANAGGVIDAGTLSVTDNAISGVTSGDQGIVSLGTLNSSGNGQIDQLAFSSGAGLATTGSVGIGYATPQAFPLTVSGSGQFNGTELNLHNSDGSYTVFAIDSSGQSRVQFRDNNSNGKWEFGSKGNGYGYDLSLYNDNLGADALTVASSTSSVTFAAPIKPGAIAVGVANSCSMPGQMAWVTDATVAYESSVRGAQITGSGSNSVPAFCDGAVWRFSANDSSGSDLTPLTVATANHAGA